MANTVIDTLEVKITASAQSATGALQSLTKALTKVRQTLTGIDKNGLKASDHIAKSLNEMNGALNTLSTNGIKKLQKLANALNDYADALKRVRHMTGHVPEKISATKAAIEGEEVKSGMERSQGSTQSVDKGKVFDKHIDEEKLRRREALLGKIKDRIQQINRELSKTQGVSKKTAGIVEQFVRSIARIAFYRAIRSALKAVTEAFSEGLKNAYLFSKQSTDFTRLAEALDRVKSATQQMVNQIGAFWGEFRQFIQPAVEWLIDKIRYLAERLTELFAVLNGEDTYQFAKLQAIEWEEATKEVEKYKHQLLGLDELNNLSKKDNSNKKTDNTKDAFEIKNVSDQFKSIGLAWQGLKETIQGYFAEIYNELTLPIAMAAIGALLLFTGHPLVGLGLLYAGVTWTYEKLEWNDQLKGDLQQKFEEYKDLFYIGSAAAIALGTILLFVPTKRLLGLGLILGGSLVKGLADSNLNFNWGGLKKTINKHLNYQELFTKGGAIATAIGTILLFVPGKRLLGLGLLLAGKALKDCADTDNLEFSWGGLRKTVSEKFEQYQPLFKVGGAVIKALGLILLFVPTKRLLGLGLLLAGNALESVAEKGFTFEWDELYRKVEDKFRHIFNLFKYGSMALGVVGAIMLFIPGMEGLGFKLIKASLPGIFASITTFDWGGLLKSLQDAWKGIGDWWRNTVKPAIEQAVGWVAEQFSLENAFEIREGSFADWLINDIIRGKKNNNSGGGSGSKFAMGGIPEHGTLFYAGEQGAEFVGNIGNTSAVANTEQMTDAIYKAAYMGMSRALAENGGNGLAGFVPATTDDLFIAMRKKASNYNKATGSSAFA